MKCAWKGPHLFYLGERYRDYQCPQESEYGFLCLFHAPKNRPTDGASAAERTQWTEMNERCEAQFPKLLEKLLNDPDVTKCDFRGFQLHIKHPWLRKLREWVNSYGVYRALSNYGTSYVQALLVLVAFLCIFSLAFLYSGFRTMSEGPQRTIEYNILANPSHHQVSAKEWTEDYLSAMSLCASIVTFQKDRFYEPLPGISRMWLFLAVIAFAGQVAMTLLALRRRFRR